MPLSAAERAKRYRDKIKSDPARHEEYIQNERDRYKARRDRGDFDLSQKTERERRQIRRTWRETKGRAKKSKNMLDPDVIGQWCVIHYDKSVYPGIIQDIDNESAEVNCMCSIGNNRFFWGLVEDCIWYKLEDVLSLIPEPKNVTNRHKQIDPDIWKSLERFMDND